MQVPANIDWLRGREDGAAWLDRLRPGDRLSASASDLAVGAIIGLVQRLSVPATEPFTTLADEATHWGAELPRQWGAFHEDQTVPRHVQTARWLID